MRTALNHNIVTLDYLAVAIVGVKRKISSL